MTIFGLHRRGLPARPLRLLAAGAAALVLAVGLAAASPALHHWLHPDAGRPDHECAITLFAHGAVQSGAAIVLVVVPLLRIVGAIAIPPAPDLITPRFRLCPGRAPPGF